jgi:hypothetical protein
LAIIVSSRLASSLLTPIPAEQTSAKRSRRVLEECPDGLAELRGVLLKEHEWRRREGLA